MDQVAPADTAIGKRDLRVVVEKRPSSEKPGPWVGNYRLQVDLGDGRKRTDWFSKAGDAKATGLRMVAIADWHREAAERADAAAEAAVDPWKPVVDAMSE